MIFKDKEVLKKLNVLLKYSIQRDRAAMGFIENLVAKFEKMIQSDLFSIKETVASMAYDIAELVTYANKTPKGLKPASKKKRKGSKK